MKVFGFSSDTISYLEYLPDEHYKKLKLDSGRTTYDVIKSVTEEFSANEGIEICAIRDDYNSPMIAFKYKAPWEYNEKEKLLSEADLTRIFNRIAEKLYLTKEVFGFSFKPEELDVEDSVEITDFVGNDEDDCYW